MAPSRLASPPRAGVFSPGGGAGSFSGGAGPSGFISTPTRSGGHALQDGLVGVVAPPVPAGMEFPEVDPEAWKHIPGSRRRQLYADAVATSGGADPTSAAWGKALVRVLATLPRGMLDLRGLRKIMHQQRRRHKDSSVEVHNPSLTPQPGTAAVVAAGESPQKPAAPGEPGVRASLTTGADVEQKAALASSAPSASDRSPALVGRDSSPSPNLGGIAAMAIAMATAASKRPEADQGATVATATDPSPASASAIELHGMGTSDAAGAHGPVALSQAESGALGTPPVSGRPGNAGVRSDEQTIATHPSAALGSVPVHPAAMQRLELGPGGSPSVLGFGGPAADVVGAHSSPGDYYARHLPSLPRHYARESVMDNAPSDATIIKVRSWGLSARRVAHACWVARSGCLSARLRSNLRRARLRRRRRLRSRSSLALAALCFVLRNWHACARTGRLRSACSALMPRAP